MPADTHKPRILSCGEVLWDLFPEGARFGGAPANFACHAAILGGTVSILSAVGKDARGDEALAILKGFGMDTSLVRAIADAPTGSVGVSVDAAGKPSFEIHAGSAWDRIAWTDALKARIAKRRFLCRLRCVLRPFFALVNSPLHFSLAASPT